MLDSRTMIVDEDTPPQRFPSKGTTEILDYTFDLSQWLQSGETIVSCNFSIVPGSISPYNQSNTSATATIWLNGGVPYTNYQVILLVATSNSPTRTKRFIGNLVVTDE